MINHVQALADANHRAAALMQKRGGGFAAALGLAYHRADSGNQARILGAFGHMGVMANSGEEALERLATEAFDILLIDIHMPVMTGIDVVRFLRASGGPQSDIPIIALTADVYSRRPAEYLALGFNDFVSKPILVAGLMETIKRCLVASPVALSRVG